jgi:hypothetical protein
MIENIMHRMGGITGFGIISVCIFFGFFAGMLLWALCLKKSYLNTMRHLPLDNDSLTQTETESKRSEIS